MKIKKVKYQFLMLFLVFTFTLKAQIIQPVRFEMTLKDTENMQVLSAGRSGLILMNPTTQPTAVDDSWQIIKLDTSFQMQWTNNITIGKGLKQLDQYYDEQHMHLLFSDPSARRGDLELISVSPKGSIERATIKSFIPLNFFDFTVINDIILISGYFNYRPLVILYDLNEKIPRVLPGFFNDRSEIIEVKVNKEGTFNVLLAGKDHERNNTIFINTYDLEGELIRKVVLNADKSKGLLFGREQGLDDFGQLVAGVYGRRNSEYSRGLFIANVNAYGEQKIKFYNYAELKNFFSYMKIRRENRIRRRIARKKIRNKKIRFNYRLLVHDLVKRGDQYLLMGEAFYPKYKTMAGGGGIFQSGWGGNSGRYATNMVFDGYHYTHAVIMGFDEEGNLLWDNSFEIEDILSYELEQFVHMSSGKRQDDLTMALLYVYDNAIRVKIIEGSKVIESKEEVKIALANEGDTAADGATRISGLEKWYDEVFFIYGEQTIRNHGTEGVLPVRRVFFVNKVVYE